MESDRHHSAGAYRLAAAAGQGAGADSARARCSSTASSVSTTSGLPVIVATTDRPEDDAVERRSRAARRRRSSAATSDDVLGAVSAAARDVRSDARSCARPPTIRSSIRTAPRRVLDLGRRVRADHVVECGLPVGAAVEAVTRGRARHAPSALVTDPVRPRARHVVRAARPAVPRVARRRARPTPTARPAADRGHAGRSGVPARDRRRRLTPRTTPCRCATVIQRRRAPARADAIARLSERSRGHDASDQWIVGVGGLGARRRRRRLGARRRWAATCAIFVQPEALAVVFGGTAAALLVSFPGPILRSAIRGRRRPRRRRPAPLEALLPAFIGYARKARRQGLRAVEREAADAGDGFLEPRRVALGDRTLARAGPRSARHRRARLRRAAKKSARRCSKRPPATRRRSASSAPCSA